RGIAATRNRLLQAQLVGSAALLRGDAPLGFLEEVATGKYAFEDGPRERRSVSQEPWAAELAAARALLDRGRSSGVDAMIKLWETKTKAPVAWEEYQQLE